MQTVLLIIQILTLAEISATVGMLFAHMGNPSGNGSMFCKKDEEEPQEEEAPEKSLQEAWEKLMSYKPSGVGGFGSSEEGDPYDGK